MAGKGGGAWKVAYADFVTAMMAFFLVMWIVAQNKPIKEAVAQYFKDPTGYGNRAGNHSPLPSKDGGSSMIDKGPYAASKVKPTIAATDPTEQRTAARSNRISLNPEDNSTVGMLVPFAEDSAELDDAGKKALNNLLPELAGKICKIELRGHASGRRPPADSPYKNAWELSFARSVATMEYFVEKGIDPRRLRLSQSGSNDPNMQALAENTSGQNSRVEVYVLSEVITTPADAEKIRKSPKKTAPKRPKFPSAFKEAEPESDEE